MNIKDLLDPEVVEVAESIPPEFCMFDRKNVQNIRRMVDQIFDSPPSLSSVVETTIRAISGKSGDITLYVSQPKNLSANGPALLWMHGGGYLRK